MKTLSSTLCALVCVLGSTSMAHAIETTPTNKVAISVDIDSVLNKLSQQKSVTPALFQTSDEPSLLSANSVLITSKKLPTSPEAKQKATTSSNQTNSKVSTKDDMLSRLTLVASNAVKRFKQTGRASWYGSKFHGRKTASGERFNMNSLTAAHKTLPFNTYLKVTNKANGKSVVVKVNDRGPSSSSRVLDLSYGAAKKVGLISRGVANVTIEKVSAP